MSNYQEGVAALRELLQGFETEDHEVAAKAAEEYLRQVESPTSILAGLDVGAMARTTLALTAIMLLMRDASVDKMEEHHTEEECEDLSGCECSHEELDLTEFTHYIAGLDTALDALAGIALALADRELGFDPDEVDWTNTSDWGKYDG